MAQVAITRHQVDVGGYRLAVWVAGAGSPTVVLEAGGGCTSETWAGVAPAIAQLTRVVRYDRAGLGASEAAPRQRTCDDMVADLHALLTTAALPSPYVLVGHSFGGLIVQHFAHAYLAEVAGMVLVDATHPDQNNRAAKLLPPPMPSDSSRLVGLRRTLTMPYQEDPSDPEGIDIRAGAPPIRVAGLLGSIPLVVLTAGRHAGPPDLPADFLTQYERMAQELQRDLTRLSTQSTHVIAARSDHFIHDDEPELVIDAIRQVVGLARRQ